MPTTYYTWNIGNDRYNELLVAIEKGCTKYSIEYEIISDFPIVDGHFYGGLYDSATDSYIRRLQVKFINDRQSQIDKMLLEV